MNTKSIIVFILVTIGILVGAVFILTKSAKEEAQPVEGVEGQARHVKGEGEITLVEFSDLQCPACKSVQAPLKTIMQKYEGKVRLVYRHFPLTTIHDNALASSFAAEAAGMQDKFWEMHDLLFEKQQEWANLDDPTGKFVEYAGMLELEISKFEEDMKSSEVREAVNLDNLDATRLQLSGTPSFFINGVATEFAQLDGRLAELTQE